MGKNQTHLDRVIESLEGLSREEVKKLRDILNTYLSYGYLETVSPDNLYYRFYKRGRQQTGPYRYRRVWKDGKLISRSEGKAEPGEYEAWLQARTR